MFACADQRDVVDEVDVDDEIVSQVTAEGGEHLVQHVLGEATTFDHAEGERARSILDHLEALDRVIELLEIVSEEGAWQEVSARALDDGLDTTLDVADASR